MSEGVTPPAPAGAVRRGLGDKLRGSMAPVFVGLAAALVALALVIGQTIVAQREARVRAMNEGETLLALQAVLTNMLDAETGQRGYVLTGDNDYLPPYLGAKNRLAPTIENLRKVASRAGDTETVNRITWIASIADAKFAEMDRTVTLTRTGMRSQAMMIVGSNIGKEQMDAIRDAIASESRRKAQSRRDGFANADRLERRLIPLITVLGAAIVLLVIAGFRAERSRALVAAEAEQAGALRDANARIELLARELNHRVKNLFSVVLSIVTLSGRSQPEARGVVDNIRARIHALSLAHAVSQGATGTTSVELGPVVRKTMEPYIDDEGQRVKITGPAVELPARMITPLGMIVHELATNAVKYGALSQDGGTIAIDWDLRTGEDGTEELCLDWTETGGPELAYASGAPANSGFGSQMTRLAANQLGGTLHREWPPGGAVLRLTFPMPRAAPSV